MLVDIQKLTDILAIDADGRFSPEDRAAAIELALFRYSSDRPRAACETVEFDGSAFLSMPDGWQKDFSRVLEIKTECGKRVPFETVPSLSGEKILLSGDVRTGDVLTVWFTQRHVATEQRTPFRPPTAKLLRTGRRRSCWTAWRRDTRAPSIRRFRRTAWNTVQKRTTITRRRRLAANSTATTWDWTTKETRRRERRSS